MTRAYNTATTQQNSGGAVSGVTAGKNAIINGGFDNWQRGTSFNSSTDTSLFTADRFQCYSGAGSNVVLSRQSSGLTGFQYCARVARNASSTATNLVWVTHTIETVESLKFAGQTITFSFWARAGANFSPTSSTVNVAVVYGSGTNQNVLNGFTGETSIISSSFAPTTTWTRYTFTGTVNSAANQLGFTLKHTPTGTAGAADYYEITGVQLEVGSVATPFSRAGGTIAGELAACQRYYYVAANGASQVFASGLYVSASQVNGFTTFPVTMRTAPTLVAPTGTDYYRADSGVFDNFNSLTLYRTSTQSTGFYNNAQISGTAYQPCQLEVLSSSAYVAFSAEL